MNFIIAVLIIIVVLLFCMKCFTIKKSGGMAMCNNKDGPYQKKCSFNSIITVLCTYGTDVIQYFYTLNNSLNTFQQELLNFFNTENCGKVLNMNQNYPTSDFGSNFKHTLSVFNTSGSFAYIFYLNYLFNINIPSFTQIIQRGGYYKVQNWDYSIVHSPLYGSDSIPQGTTLKDIFDSIEYNIRNKNHDDPRAFFSSTVKHTTTYVNIRGIWYNFPSLYYPSSVVTTIRRNISEVIRDIQIDITVWIVPNRIIENSEEKYPYELCRNSEAGCDQGCVIL